MRKAVLVTLALSAATLTGLSLWWPRPRPAPTAAALALNNEDEASAIALSNGMVWRSGPALSFHLKNGQVLTLTDHLACGDIACPKEVATQFRYRGWDAAAGGYLLAVSPSPAPLMILPYDDNDAVLVDARHAAAPDGPIALPTPPPPGPADESIGEWLDDLAKARSQSEAPFITGSGGAVTRNGRQLILSLQGKRKLTLTDDLVCGQVSCPPQVFRSFDYAGSSPNGQFLVVEEQWDEASAAILVDTRTGAVTSMLGPPKFSPDGQRAVASVTDLEWSAPRRLEVWTLAGAAPGMEFSLPAREEDDTVYEIVAWVDPDHVRLRHGPWASDRRTEVMLVHDRGGWHIESADMAN